MDCLALKTALMLRIAFPVSAIFFGSCAVENSEKIASEPELLPYYNTPDFTPQFFVTADQAHSGVAHTIGDFSLEDQDGNVITRNFVHGKIHVADFFFTSCGSICPKMTTNMMKVSEAFADDTGVVILSYSVTPWHDDVATLKEYATQRDIDSPQWRLLTGPKSEIYNLARQSYFAEQEIGYTKDSTEFLHTEHFILVDESGRIRGIYDGTMPVDVEQLISDINALKGQRDKLAWK
jgi:protein SCO1